MAEYRYSGIPLTPSIASNLLLPFLETRKQPTKRVEIIRYVESEHNAGGGLSVPDVEQRIKKALNTLTEEGKIVSPAVGYYVAANPKIADSTDPNDKPIVATVIDESMKAESVIGDGDESVYVYFAESERKLAKLEGRSTWPCKVGFTAGSVSARILSQISTTSFARLPTIGLVIRTEDGHSLEQIIHRSLDFSGKRVDDSVGSEWFETSPDEVSNWFGLYKKSLSAFGAT